MGSTRPTLIAEFRAATTLGSDATGTGGTVRLLMIGGGGSGCERADHGIGITETNDSTFQDCRSDSGEVDFGNEAKHNASTSYSLNLWVR